MSVLKCIHHINFIVADLEAAVDAYQTTLGLGPFEYEDLEERPCTSPPTSARAMRPFLARNSMSPTTSVMEMPPLPVSSERFDARGTLRRKLTAAPRPRPERGMSALMARPVSTEISRTMSSASSSRDHAETSSGTASCTSSADPSPIR